MKTLHLNLKKKWFDMILAGEKKSEYRDLSEYWAVRLVTFNDEMSQSGMDDMDEFLVDLKCPFRRHDDVGQLMVFFDAEFKSFDKIHFKNGFARNGKPAPCFDIEFGGITVRQGRAKWGAEDKKFYFVLKLGNVLPQAANEKQAAPGSMKTTGAWR